MSINVKIQSMSTITKNNRRVSPLATLNKDLVKQLCDLHPWDLKELCAQARLDQTVLSHFFAGRRPFHVKDRSPRELTRAEKLRKLCVPRRSYNK